MPQPADSHSPDTEHESARPIQPAETLPEVQPPTAGFILQLFVIPGVIVLAIILVWLLFSWLAHMGGDPRSYLEAMKQNRANSWQQAYNLVESLRQNDEYRNDSELAKDLAAFLDELLDKPLPKSDAQRARFARDARSEEIERRGFLCKALGEFHVASDSLPILIRAAGSHSADDELRVRLAALEAIALLAENVPDQEMLANEDLLPLLLNASQSSDHKIALRAAMALAAVGNSEAIARLEQMVGEPQHVDVHYNVATGLARNGSVAAVDLLVEMLDPDETRGIEGEDQQSAPFKRAVIMLNALRAARMLAEANPDADLQPLVEATRLLRAAEMPAQIQMEAAATLRVLEDDRSSQTEAAA